MRADVLRLGFAVRQKGIDPRVWCTGGRVVNEDGAVRWDVNLGWIVDVAPSGDLFGSEVRGRVLSNGFSSVPVPEDAEVLLGVAEGEPDTNTVVLGFLNNGDGNGAPKTVTGLVVNGAVPASAASFDSLVGFVSPYDTELTNSPYSKREEYKGDHVDVAANQVLEAADPLGQVRLATRIALQAFIRGNDYTTAELAFLNGVLTLANANVAAYTALAAASTGPLSPLQSQFSALAAAWTAFLVPLGAFQSAIPATLSLRIKGE